MRFCIQYSHLLLIGCISIYLLFYLFVLKKYHNYKNFNEATFPYGTKNFSRDFYIPHVKQIYTKNDTKLILTWTEFFGEWNWSILPNGKETFMNCNFQNCLITSDSNLYSQSDAIIFHAPDFFVTRLPKYRYQNQKWTFYSLESPHYSYFNGFNYFNNIFNWTMSYRLDSDITVTYGKIIKLSSIKKKNVGISKQDWEKKKRTIVWMVSHCFTNSKRETYVTELQKYIDVDIFGKCGKAICRNSTIDCIKNFSITYKFYLSFENSVCKDYVTEKFYTILNYNMIPIVLGGADYKKIAPSNSYIDALNFTSPKELAKYIYKVGKNYTLYNSYLNWKSSYSVISGFNHCDLCEKLNTESYQVVDLKQWWVEQANCRNWKSN